MKKILSLLSVITLLSCSGNKDPQPKEADKPHIGKYVYLDKASVLHTTNGCKAIFKDHNMQQVNPVEPECLSYDILSKVCSQCVTEQIIDSLKVLFDKNRPSYANVGEVYEDLVKSYDLPSELQFRKDIRIPRFSRAIYKVMHDEKYFMGSYEEFTEWLGLEAY